jgi:lipoprotein-releasing system permease protein
MKRWTLFISARHFRTRRREKGHTASILSVGGIAAGVMTLVVVLAVMNGFQIGTIEDILEINSYHLQVRTEDAEQTASLVAGTDGVQSAVPLVDMYALAQGFFADPIAIAVRGLHEDVQTLDPGFARQLQIVTGAFDLATPRSIVIGEELSRRIGLRVGDSLSVVNFSAEGLNLARPDSMDLLVTGKFKTGFLEYDAGWGFVSLATAAELGGGQPDVIGVKLRDRFADREAIRHIHETVPGLDVVSWRDYNRSIFGALRLEKTLMMSLVGLIFVVVGVNIYQSLRRSVVERTEEIGVLKALGASAGSLQFVFVLEGLMIGLAGAILGTALGLLLSFNINAVFSGAELVVNGILTAVGWIAGLFAPGQRGPDGGFAIFSPAYFYLDSVPATVVAREVIGVALFALGSAVVAAVAASRRISGIIPAAVLRYE